MLVLQQSKIDKSLNSIFPNSVDKRALKVILRNKYIKTDQKFLHKNNQSTLPYLGKQNHHSHKCQSKTWESPVIVFAPSLPMSFQPYFPFCLQNNSNLPLVSIPDTSILNQTTVDFHLHLCTAIHQCLCINIFPHSSQSDVLKKSDVIMSLPCLKFHVDPTISSDAVHSF